MAVTPETVTRHELVGLKATIVSATNPDLEGVSGEVVTETTKTLGLAGSDGVRHVPKDVATVEFELPTGTTVTVEGEQLVGRPARRTERRGDSKWR